MLCQAAHIAGAVDTEVCDFVWDQAEMENTR